MAGMSLEEKTCDDTEIDNTNEKRDYHIVGCFIESKKINKEDETTDDQIDEGLAENRPSLGCYKASRLYRISRKNYGIFR